MEQSRSFLASHSLGVARAALPWPMGSSVGLVASMVASWFPDILLLYTHTHVHDTHLCVQACVHACCWSASQLDPPLLKPGLLLTQNTCRALASRGHPQAFTEQAPGHWLLPWQLGGKPQLPSGLCYRSESTRPGQRRLEVGEDQQGLGRVWMRPGHVSSCSCLHSLQAWTPSGTPPHPPQGAAM